MLTVVVGGIDVGVGEVRFSEELLVLESSRGLVLVLAAAEGRPTGRGIFVGVADAAKTFSLVRSVVDTVAATDGEPVMVGSCVLEVDSTIPLCRAMVVCCALEPIEDIRGLGSPWGWDSGVLLVDDESDSIRLTVACGIAEICMGGRLSACGLGGSVDDGRVCIDNQVSDRKKVRQATPHPTLTFPRFLPIKLEALEPTLSLRLRSGLSLS
jgi:hypothetical protein